MSGEETPHLTGGRESWSLGVNGRWKVSEMVAVDVVLCMFKCSCILQVYEHGHQVSRVLLNTCAYTYLILCTCRQ